MISTLKTTRARVILAALAAPALSLGVLVPSASAATMANYEPSSASPADDTPEGSIVNPDVANVIWTAPSATALRPPCNDGANSADADAFLICPWTD